jgi:hypothetical protein
MLGLFTMFVFCIIGPLQTSPADPHHAHNIPAAIQERVTFVASCHSTIPISHSQHPSSYLVIQHVNDIHVFVTTPPF